VQTPNIKATMAVAAIAFASLLTYAQDKTVPAQITDEAFWGLIQNFSEDGAAYDSFLISNETGFQAAIPELLRRTHPGGAYIGVGAEQNFTYIAAIRPSLAFIVDIRRENVAEHLMYKALFELSANRSEFLSMLFAQPPALVSNESSSVSKLFAAYDHVTIDPERTSRNLQLIKNNLTITHHLALTIPDLSDIDRIYRTLTGHLYEYGRLMNQVDAEGQMHSYLASEEDFRFVQGMQKKNLIVPVVGDFAGNKALRNIGAYLKQNDVVVSTFYTSNVERLLFSQGSWRRFYSNVDAFPVDSQSSFVRALSEDSRFVSHASSISKLIMAITNGSVQNFEQAVAQ
jgi:hypothetical protein